MSERFPELEPENTHPVEREPRSADLLNTVARYGYLSYEYGFDSETNLEISLMDFSEAVETVYSYLTSAGLNADEILAGFFQ